MAGYDQSHRLSGWTFGGGLEVAPENAKSLTLRLEYMHTELSSGGFSKGLIPGIARDVSSKSDAVMARVNFKLFGGH